MGLQLFLLKKRYQVRYFLVFFLFFICNIHFTVFANHQCVTKISSIQVAQAESIESTKAPSQGWVTLKKLPDRWEQRWPNFHDVAWYKINFEHSCPPEIDHQPFSLSIQRITRSGKIFLNDQLLWQDITIDEHQTRSQYMPRIWNLPYSHLNNGENTLLIQVQGIITQQSGLGYVSLGSYEEVYKKYKQWLLEQRTLPSINMLVNLVIGIFFFLSWLASRKDKAFLWLSLTCFAWSLYTSSILHIHSVFFHPITLDKIQNIIFCFYVVSGCVGAWYFANKPLLHIQKILFAFFFIATFSILLAPTIYSKQIIQFFFFCAVAIFLLRNITYPYFAYQSKQPETYLLSFIYLIYIPIAVHDAKFMITMEGHPLSPYTGPLATMCVGGILAMRLARNTRQIEKFNKTLEEGIAQAKLQLTNSLAQQYELSIENVRLQERISLSHDLHDGLGGSIVRSIMHLEKHQHVDQAQMISILKMLRNDLRQVIDIGSIQSSQVPSSPVEWGAAIRYKFTQIFDELDIYSKWDFDQQWKKAPIALQCLTLTRVTEEALTNILKHSQASEVYVSLLQTESFDLILTIQDNGCGFDPSIVESGLHVGLQSMRLRVQRLNGIFTVESEPKKTTLKALISVV